MACYVEKTNIMCCYEGVFFTPLDVFSSGKVKAIDGCGKDHGLKQTKDVMFVVFGGD